MGQRGGNRHLPSFGLDGRRAESWTAPGVPSFVPSRGRAVATRAQTELGLCRQVRRTHGLPRNDVCVYCVRHQRAQCASEREGAVSEDVFIQVVTRVVAGSVLSGGVVSVSALSGSLPAGATTAVKLYVSTTGTGTECTKTSPCSSIDEAVTVAEALTGDNVIIKVAAGTYGGSHFLFGSEYIDAGSLQSLSLEGAGASRTIMNAGTTNERVMYLAAGTVSLSGFTIENGNPLDGPGSGIYNVAAMLKVSNTDLLRQHGRRRSDLQRGFRRLGRLDLERIRQ